VSFNSRINYTGLTGTGPFSYSGIALLNDRLVTEQSQLVVQLNGSSLSYVSSGPVAGEYTLNKDTKQLTTGDTLVAEDFLLIRRATKRDAMHVIFENNAPLSADDLNLACTQLLYLIQEALETYEADAEFQFSGTVNTLYDGEIILDLKAGFIYDIDSITLKLTDGTCDAILSIDDVVIANSNLSVTDTEVSNTLSLTANRVVTGNTLKLTITNLSSEGTENLSFSIGATKV
jgi:hypothetical protein